jgi:hypothetical protein
MGKENFLVQNSNCAGRVIVAGAVEREKLAYTLTMAAYAEKN